MKVTCSSIKDLISDKCSFLLTVLVVHQNVCFKSTRPIFKRLDGFFYIVLKFNWKFYTMISKGIFLIYVFILFLNFVGLFLLVVSNFIEFLANRFLSAFVYFLCIILSTHIYICIYAYMIAYMYCCRSRILLRTEFSRWDLHCSE